MLKFFNLKIKSPDGMILKPHEIKLHEIILDINDICEGAI